MFYLISQIAVFLLITGLLGVALGWLVRSINARAEVDALERRMQVQLRDMRNRAAGAARGGTSQELAEAMRVQQQLRHQVAKLQGLVEQREKEIAHLRRLLGDQRSSRTAEGAEAPKGQ